MDLVGKDAALQCACARSYSSLVQEHRISHGD